MNRQVSSKKPLKVELKNAESKYKTFTDLEDLYIPGLFIGFRVCEDRVKSMRMCKFACISSKKGTFNAPSSYVPQHKITRRIRKKPFMQI